MLKLEREYSLGFVIYPDLFEEGSKWDNIFKTEAGINASTTINNYFYSIIYWLRSIQNKAGAQNEIETSLHFNLNNKINPIRYYSELSKYLSHEKYQVKYKKANEQLEFRFNSLLHFPYSKKYLPLNQYFIPELLNHIKICDSLGCEAIVIHPPEIDKKLKKDDKRLLVHQFIKELCSKELIKAIKKYNIVICIENTQEKDTHFQSLENLVKMRSKLSNELKIKREVQLLKHFKFCFDTGHYLLFQQRDKNGNSDWIKYSSEFISNTKIFHIHSNDGVSDLHLIPSKNKIKKKNSDTVDTEQLLKNNETVIDWIQLSHQYWNIENTRHLILEINPDFTEEEIISFWSRIIKK
ncbi:MAG: TIM barrel protein [archaeon]|nr:TIM barrel protein [archaeon]